MPIAKKPKKKIPKYPCRDTYSHNLDNKLGGIWYGEYPFHPTRKWRFDYANPTWKIAIEIDGGLYDGYHGRHAGRHSGGKGQKDDMEKMNAAAELGWLVFHYIPTEKWDVRTYMQIYRTIKRLKNEENNERLP